LGNLGLKSPAQTGVYRTMRLDAKGSELAPGSLVDELLATDGSPVLVSFTFPTNWKLSVKGSVCESLTSCSPGSIDARDLTSGDSAFVLVANGSAYNAATGFDAKQKEIEMSVRNFVFSRFGKYGVYGAPDDVRLVKVEPNESGATRLQYKFVTFTPNMRTLSKQCFVTAVPSEGDIFMLVTVTNQSRWKQMESELERVADSFRVSAAPKSSKKMSRKRFETVPGLDSNPFVLPGAEYENDE